MLLVNSIQLNLFLIELIWFRYMLKTLGIMTHPYLNKQLYLLIILKNQVT